MTSNFGICRILNFFYSFKKNLKVNFKEGSREGVNMLLGGLAVNAAIFIVNGLNNKKIGVYNRRVVKAVGGKAVPILFTILSTCFGLIPFIMEGQNEIFWFSLAIGTIGGLVFSVVGVFLALPVFLWRKDEVS
nr:efflux RND transporter permease subunit [Indibacter alkaliphilus]